MQYLMHRRQARRRHRVRTLLAVASLTAAVGVLGPTAATAAPGNPGVPSDPEVIFAETFENVATPPNHEMVDTYTGFAPLAMTYTADPIWINLDQCNGVLLTSATAHPGAPPACPLMGWQNLQELAEALGQFEPPAGGPTANYAVAHWTRDTPVVGTPAPAIEASKPIPLLAPGRFVTMSVDLGVTSCHASHPGVRFFVFDGDTFVQVTDKPIDPCTDNRATATGDNRVGRIPSDSAALVKSPTVRFKMTNDQTSSNGNDYAFDNLRLLDATPQLDKEFNPTRVTVGSATRLTFTITNTSELAAKPGWSFTDTLPKALRVANPANVSSDCPNGNAQAAGRTITVTGDLAEGATSCQVSLDVLVIKKGKFSNGAANVEAVGLLEPGKATVRGKPKPKGKPRLVLRKAVDRKRARPGETLDYTIRLKNAGKGVAKKVRVCDALPSGSTLVDAPGAATKSSQKACWRLKKLGVGKSAKFNVTARINSGFTGELVNKATARGANAPAAAAAAAPVIVTPPIACRC